MLVIEPSAPGGQAGSSSRIENYLGFPLGISGQKLAGAAYMQSQKFGAKFLIAQEAMDLSCDRKPYSIRIDEDTPHLGARHRDRHRRQVHRLPIDGLDRFNDAGVYYGATFIEAQLCKGDEVLVVGGGNSAGQAAVFLAQHASHVHMIVRANGLADTMSRYLVRRIEESPNITLHSQTEVTSVAGVEHLERVEWVNRVSGDREERDIRHMFVMCGAVPSTPWLKGCVALDARGFIKTGPAISAEELRAAQWPLARAPHLLETSLPGVFAVGNVRAGNVKRVASAVGEGSIAVSFVHQVLRE